MGQPNGPSAEPASIARLTESVEQLGEAIAIVRIGERYEEPPPIVYANLGFLRLFGYAAGELAGKTTEPLRGPLTDVEREALAPLADSLLAELPARVRG